jgi:peroxiredoxin family protein
MLLSDGLGDGAARDADYGAKKVATFEELLEAWAAMNVKFLVCEMGLRALNMNREVLRDDLSIEEGGVVTFLSDASRDGAMVFI